MMLSRDHKRLMNNYVKTYQALRPFINAVVNPPPQLKVDHDTALFKLRNYLDALGITFMNNKSKARSR